MCPSHTASRYGASWRIFLYLRACLVLILAQKGVFLMHVMFCNTKVTVSHGSQLFVLVSGVVITHLYYQKSFASLRWESLCCKNSSSKYQLWNYYYCILSFNAFPFSFSSTVFMLLWSDCLFIEAVPVCFVEKRLLIQMELEISIMYVFLSACLCTLHVHMNEEVL